MTWARVEEGDPVLWEGESRRGILTMTANADAVIALGYGLLDGAHGPVAWRTVPDR